MINAVKNAAKAAWDWATKSEPVLVINTVGLTVAAVAQEWAGEVQVGDSWKAAAWAGLALLVRRFVTPAAKAD